MLGVVLTPTVAGVFFALLRLGSGSPIAPVAVHLATKVLGPGGRPHRNLDLS